LKKTVKFTALAAASTLAISMVGIVNAPASLAAAKPKVCLALDTGGIDDHSFNASAWAGAQSVQNKATVSYVVADANNPDYTGEVKSLVDAKCDLIIGVGFLITSAIDAAGITPLMDPAEALKNGAAMDSWRQMISAQGGDPDAALPVAKEKHVVTATESGEIIEMNALAVGISAWRLGAGRSRQGEAVQAGAGIEIHAKPGEQIQAGAPLFTLHTDEAPRFERALAALEGAVRISSTGEKVERLPLILEKITG